MITEKFTAFKYLYNKNKRMTINEFYFQNEKLKQRKAEEENNNKSNEVEYRETGGLINNQYADYLKIKNTLMTDH